MTQQDDFARLSPHAIRHVPGQEYNLERSWVVQGDCRKVLADLPDRSVDLVFADPPYFLQLQNELRRPNNTVVDAGYVVTAWGRDYADVPPLKGVIFTESASSTLKVAVDVTRLERSNGQKM